MNLPHHLLLATLLLTPLGSPRATDDPKPNFIVINIDDREGS